MRASGYDRVASDYYTEPRWAIDALLDVETFTGMSWDPSCGGGNIPKAMIARDLPCIGSDIVNRGYGETCSFFDQAVGAHNIISNPPYGVIEDYLSHALKLADRKVVLLARLAFLEGQKRKAMFARTPLARVWVSSRRMSMPPGGTDIKATGGTIAYGWFVWDHAHNGPPTVGWI